VIADSGIGVDFFATVGAIVCKSSGSWVDSILTIGAVCDLLPGAGYFNGQDDKKY